MSLNPNNISVGQKVYVTSAGDAAPYYIVKGIRQADYAQVADLEGWPFGRTTFPSGQVDTLSSIGVTSLTASANQTL
jgi:hypothetical protein